LLRTPEESVHFLLMSQVVYMYASEKWFDTAVSDLKFGEFGDNA